MNIELSRLECDMLLEELALCITLIHPGCKNALLLWEKIACTYYEQQVKYPENIRNDVLGIVHEETRLEKLANKYINKKLEKKSFWDFLKRKKSK